MPFFKGVLLIECFFLFILEIKCILYLFGMLNSKLTVRFHMKEVVTLHMRVSTESTVEKIYLRVFKRINQNYVDVFLCGGASSTHKVSIRDKVREKMKKYNNIRILYPEDLFIEMLKKNRSYDLLSLESFLADNSDFICIVCESAGSLVELGAFTNNQDTVDKVVAVVEEKRKKDESFIMLGPIKLLDKLERKNKKKVVYYNRNNLESLDQELSDIFELSKFKRKKILKEKSVNNKSIDTLIGLYYFITLLLYFFKEITSDQLKDYIKNLYKHHNYKVSSLDTLFRSSLKLLQKDKYLEKHIYNSASSYTLTEKGYNEINKLLYNLDIKERTKLYDNIRFDIIRNKYYV